MQASFDFGQSALLSSYVSSMQQPPGGLGGGMGGGGALGAQAHLASSMLAPTSMPALGNNGGGGGGGNGFFPAVSMPEPFHDGLEFDMGEGLEETSRSEADLVRESVWVCEKV